MRFNPYATRPQVYDAIRGVSGGLAKGPLFLIGLMNLYNRVNVAVEFPASAWREHGYAGIRQVHP